MAIAQWSILAFFGALVGMVLVAVWLVGQARQKKAIRARLFKE